MPGVYKNSHESLKLRYISHFTLSELLNEHINYNTMRASSVVIFFVAVAISGKTFAATLKNDVVQKRFANSTSCGGLLTAEEGLIEYKLDGNYQADEVCIWTIRSPFRTGINFTMNRMGFEAQFDGVKLWRVSKYGISRAHYFSNRTDVPEEGYVISSVAIVTFHSIYSVQGKGFSLSFRATPDTDYSFKHFEDYNKKASGSEVVTFRYPEKLPYQNLEFSTFTVSRNTGDPDNNVELNITSLHLEYEFSGICKDIIHVYYFRRGMSYNDFSSVTPLDGVCDTSQVVPPIYHPGYYYKADAIVILLVTDEQNTGEGYELSYRYTTRN